MVSVCTVPARGGRSCEHFGGYKTINRIPLEERHGLFHYENLVLPVMYDSVHSVLVKQHGYIQWTNCTKNTLLGN